MVKSMIQAKLKALFLGTVAGAALIGSAAAADLPSRKEGPVILPPPVFNWNGFYVGVTAGGISTTVHTDLHDLVPLSQTTTHTGFIGGGTLGYNWQWGTTVVGIEGDISGVDNKSNFDDNFHLFGINNKTDAFGTIRARVGLAFDRTLIYVTGGVAIANQKHTVGVLDTGYSNTDYAFIWSNDSTRYGLVVGSGLEYALSSNWTAKAEFLYTAFDDKSASGSCNSAYLGCDASTWYYRDGNGVQRFLNKINIGSGSSNVIGRVGINYKF